ncbi:hypothetical protein RJ641_031308, partial [Dillenia turbinata]
MYWKWPKRSLEMLMEDKASFYLDDPKQSCRPYTSIDYAREKNLRHPCHPVKSTCHPGLKSHLGTVIGKYSGGGEEDEFVLLNMIREGLGLELARFGCELSQDQLLAINHHLPDALIQDISNGKLKSANHRLVTNTSVARTTIAGFIHPTRNCLFEPAKAIVNKCSSPQSLQTILVQRLCQHLYSLYMKANPRLRVSK